MHGREGKCRTPELQYTAFHRFLFVVFFLDLKCVFLVLLYFWTSLCGIFWIIICPVSVAVPSLDARCQCAAVFNTAFNQLFGASRACICEPTATVTFEQVQVCLFFPTLASQYLVVPYKRSLKITDTLYETEGGRYFHLESGKNVLRLSVSVKFMFDSPLTVV